MNRKIFDRQILLFDGVCNLCNGLVQFIIKRDPEAYFKFASLQSETGKAVLREFGLPEDNLDTFIYVRGDEVFTKSDAGLETLGDLGRGWQLLYGFIIVPRFIRNIFYNLVARSRYAIFGKQTECIIPTPMLRSRFL
jgi:predicted DCC family thiol-disulfide oxidoreductase YuxK